jgi:hypothetical protein
MIKVYVIPGLGTTKKLVVNLRIANAEVIVLDWPLPEKKETMTSYAKKFLPFIDVSKPFYLLGVSFGGMICTELDKLISTSKMGKYIPIHLLFSDHFHRKIAYYGRGIVGFENDYTVEFLEMLNQMKKHYFEYCIHIIVNWNNKTLPKNAFHIHGTDDKLLSHKLVKADYFIEGGTHAMIVFKAEEINAIIEKIMKS